MENLRLLFRLYVRPADTMSEIMDKGSWIFAAMAVLVVALVFYGTINTKLNNTYFLTTPTVYDPVSTEDFDSPEQRARFEEGLEKFTGLRGEKVPFVGDTFFKFFTFQPGTFYYPLLSISIFYVPLLILLMSIFARLGSFGLVIRRDYGLLATCTLMAWAAGHLPFEIIGAALFTTSVNPIVFFALWVASGLLFGVFVVFALRTVLGVNYGFAIVGVAIAWVAFTLGMFVFQHVSPWMFSPFLLFILLFHFGGALGGGARGLGNSFRQRQNFKRFLHNATVNPKDADAHVQLGLIYQHRRQDAKALEHFSKALEIDPDEIDANYHLGKIAREKGELQQALDHFAIVVGQDDKYSLHEIWREIGATYLDANMYNEAADPLEKYVDRRPVDPEGLYYLGRVLKAKGDHGRAREMFQQAMDSVDSSPPYRQREIRKWRKLAEKEI